MFNFSVKEVVSGIALTVVLIAGSFALIVLFIPRGASVVDDTPSPVTTPPTSAMETATVTPTTPTAPTTETPAVSPPPPDTVMETQAVTVQAKLTEPDLAQGLKSREGAVIYSAKDGTILPLGGFVSDTSNLYSDGYANLHNISFLHSDNPNVAMEENDIVYIPSNDNIKEETVSITVGSSIGGVVKEAQITYTIVLHSQDLDELVDSTINALDVSDEYKVALRSLPHDLNPFYVNGVTNVNISNIEEVGEVFDRVKKSSKFGWNELNNEEKLRLNQGVVALPSVIHFNEETLDYKRDDINKVLHDLNIWTDVGFFTRNFEPAWSPVQDFEILRNFCEGEEYGSFSYYTERGGENLGEYLPYHCLNELLYGLSDKGEEYYDVVNNNSDFYWSRLAEHFTILAIINQNKGTVENITEKNDERFDMLFDNYLITREGNGHSTGIGWSYGNLNSINERIINPELTVNSYNALKNVLTYERNNLLKDLNDVSATHELVEWLKESNVHSAGVLEINNHNLPGILPEEYKASKKDIEILVSASPNYFSWPKSVNLVIPKKNGGIFQVDSRMIGGGVPSLIRLMGISSEQLSTRELSQEFHTEVSEKYGLELNFLNIIKYNFKDLGVKWSEGNFTITGPRILEYGYYFGCQGITDIEFINFFPPAEINESLTCRYLGISN